MPYIKEEDRFKMEARIEHLASRIETEGELNFAITKLCHIMMEKLGEKYANYNTIMGVLECVKQEFYRRKVVPYEKKKIGENGDI
jgi:hypothetical protein